MRKFVMPVLKQKFKKRKGAQAHDQVTAVYPVAECQLSQSHYLHICIVKVT